MMLEEGPESLVARSSVAAVDIELPDATRRGASPLCSNLVHCPTKCRNDTVS
jgi:hypothetical protein